MAINPNPTVGPGQHVEDHRLIAAELAGMDATTAARVVDTGTATGAAMAETFPTLAAQAIFPASRYSSMQQATFLVDAAMTSGSAVLHSASRTFTVADVGKVIGVTGAGVISADYNALANDGVLVSTIASVSAGDAVLTHTATNTVAAGRAVFGFPIDAALQAAANAAYSAGGGVVYIPAGRWVTSVQTILSSGVSVAGSGRHTSIVHYVHTGNGADNATTPWLRSSGAADPVDGLKRGVTIRDFTIDGQFFVATTAYSSSMKLLSVNDVVDSDVLDMAITNCPATSIGYDTSTRCRIEGNTIINSGRLANIGSGVSSASGAGIGIAVTDGSAQASCVIANNFISGGYGNSPQGSGRTGIHIEGAFTSTNPSMGLYIITGNVVTGFSVGIRDSGGLGTIITANRVTGCQYSILVGTKGSSASRPGLDTVIEGNVINGGVNRFTPSGRASGIEVNTVTTTNGSTQDDARTLIRGNVVTNIPGVGIYLRGDPRKMDHVRVEGNSIRDCDQYGIQVTGIQNGLAIVHNGISSNGRAGSLRYAIRLDANVVWTGGRIDGNDFTDYQAVPTQLNSIQYTAGSSVTGVRVAGNTGDA